MVNDNSGSPRFVPEHRIQLKKLGLIEAQIDALESKLPLCRAILSHASPLQDVRDKLETLSRALESAQNAMSILLNATPLALATHEALQWLIEADEDGDIEGAMRAVALAQSVVQRAQESLPQGQRRHRADILPVRLIAEALLSGFIRGTPPVPCIDMVLSPEFIKENPNYVAYVLPPFTLKQSSSSESAFRKIVGICYEAMSQKNTDPERAIKAFLAWRKNTTTAQRKKIEIELSAARTRKPKSKLGQ